MKVKRIVANIETADPAIVARFYREVLGLELLMDHGWIATYGTQDRMPLQVSFASEGGSGTSVPGLSVEVDDVEAAYAAVLEGGYAVEYGPADEPWGVRRFFVRDPAGTLVNIVMHT
jgi:catechol 2,3-dioxygenase-like lactoylglutathione lyase family enzyme